MQKLPAGSLAVAAEKLKPSPGAEQPAHSKDLEAAVLDTQSPARGLLKEAEAERLSHVSQPSSVKFVSGGTQPASEGAI